jgi:hypothetical protein
MIWHALKKPRQLPHAGIHSRGNLTAEPEIEIER